ncbi:mannose-specific PTS system transporter subunit IIC [Escherichia coli]|uniref:Mannose-specific PTS system transporter subunit IIC n=1 Tax=Escherichia coli TaxID=562 RepID=A0A377BC17_ECOLX|nr:mannose-specific PTS system transporter subunit IIC [Escherichia coli]
MLQLRLTPLWLLSFLPFWLSQVIRAIGAGIALAIPLAAAGQVLTIIVRTITVAFQHAADKAADNGNLTAISWIHVSSLFLQAMRVAIRPSSLRCLLVPAKYRTC